MSGPRTRTKYEYDNESGNHYAIFRSYVNRLGRFSTPDLLGGDPTDPQSFDRYEYALNGPCDLVDKLGLSPPCIINIKINNQSDFGNTQIQAIERQINAEFGTSTGLNGEQVEANFNFSGDADYTLTLTTDKPPSKYSNAWGIAFPGFWGGWKSPTVYVNNITKDFYANGTNGALIDQFTGTVGAHELVHNIAAIGDLPYDSNAPNDLMSMDFNPNQLNLIESNGFKLTPKEVSVLYQKKCPPSGGGGFWMNPLKFCLYFPWMCRNNPE